VWVSYCPVRIVAREGQQSPLLMYAWSNLIQFVRDDTYGIRATDSMVWSSVRIRMMFGRTSGAAEAERPLSVATGVSRATVPSSARAAMRTRRASECVMAVSLEGVGKSGTGRSRTVGSASRASRNPRCSSSGGGAAA
jgi:hypothetical protein